jgi:hypothetical protein
MQIRTALWRWTTAFALEAYLAAGLLTLFGYLPATFAAMFGFTVIATLLLAFGGWLYQGGGRSMTVHLLLYPVILAAGVASFLMFDSWLAAILLAGGYFWRIHTIVTIRIYHFDLLRRFALAVLSFLGCLIYQTIIVPVTKGNPSIIPLFGMLAALLLTFLVCSWGEFLTREKPVGISVAPALRWRFALELGQAKLAVLGGYVALASALFFLGAFLWAWVKALVGPFLYSLAAPLLRMIERWITQLAGTLAKDKRIDLVTGSDGEAGTTIDAGDIASGPSLFERLEPYLAAAVIAAFAAWLGWKMWQRRHRPAEQTVHLQASSPETAVSRLEQPASGSGNALGSRIRDMFGQWFGHQDDKARYVYSQFLRYMAAQGLPMRKDETSREFMLRVQSVWLDEQRVSLVAKITDFYQRHRYHQRPLTEEELAALENCLQQLKSSPVR